MRSPLGEDCRIVNTRFYALAKAAHNPYIHL